MNSKGVIVRVCAHSFVFLYYANQLTMLAHADMKCICLYVFLQVYPGRQEVSESSQSVASMNS